MNGLFVLNNILLGFGLAMDAFSVSLANGLNEPGMSHKKHIGIAGTFALFQAIMPMTGWICVHTIIEYFQAFQKFIPWIALILLGYIGGNMIYESSKGKEEQRDARLGTKALLFQGIATSIDALSVGFLIGEYNLITALVASIIIAAVTFIVCFGGVILGKKAGIKLADKANILGGVILIAIGIEIFVSSIL